MTPTQVDAGGTSPRRARLRSLSAVLAWGLCALAAVVLALGALLVALRVDEASRGFGDVVRLADVLDLGLLERGRGLVSDPVLDVVLPWGLTALGWLVVGRVLVALAYAGSAPRPEEVGLAGLGLDEADSEVADEGGQGPVREDGAGGA